MVPEIFDLVSFNLTKNELRLIYNIPQVKANHFFLTAMP